MRHATFQQTGAGVSPELRYKIISTISVRLSLFFAFHCLKNRKFFEAISSNKPTIQALLGLKTFACYLAVSASVELQASACLWNPRSTYWNCIWFPKKGKPTTTYWNFIIELLIFPSVGKVRQASTAALSKLFLNCEYFATTDSTREEIPESHIPITLTLKNTSLFYDKMTKPGVFVAITKFSSSGNQSSQTLGVLLNVFIWSVGPVRSPHEATLHRHRKNWNVLYGTVLNFLVLPQKCCRRSLYPQSITLLTKLQKKCSQQSFALSWGLSLVIFPKRRGMVMILYLFFNWG